MSFSLGYDSDEESDTLWKYLTVWTNQNYESWEDAGKPRDIAKKIQSLSLNRYFISSIKDITLFFTDLKSLELNDNSLATIPESIGNLVKLTSLSITNNRLNEIPDSITRLRSLRGLTLGNNYLSKLPESIGDLTELEYLELNYNALKTLPESIQNLRKLKTLTVEYNRLSDSALSFISSLSSNTALKIYYENQETDIDDSEEDEGDYEDDDSEDNEFTINELNEKLALLKTVKRPLNSSNEMINITKEGYNVIDGNVNIQEFMNEPDNQDVVAFQMNDNVFLVDLQNIRDTYEKSIFFECIELNNIDSINIEPTKILFNVRNIGLPINYVYISQLNTLLYDKPSKYYVFRKSNASLVTVASVESVRNHIANPDTLLTSSAHCQEGQTGDVYDILISTSVTSGGGKRNNTTRKTSKKPRLTNKKRATQKKRKHKRTKHHKRIKKHKNNTKRKPKTIKMKK